MELSQIEIESKLLFHLKDQQKLVVRSPKRRVLVIAGAGSGKTEVMARRVAWWVGIDKVPKEQIVAFTFTERAAEEMKFRIRSWIEQITAPDEDATIGDMYVGTIHGFCLKTLREYWPDTYHNYDVIDEGARLALVQRGYYGVLGLGGLQAALHKGMYATVEYFLEAYDLLNEYDQLEVRLPSKNAPHEHKDEAEWCKGADLKNTVGKSNLAKAFALCAARYYAFLRCRRFLDFSTSQSELSRQLKTDPASLTKLRRASTHIVVDEVQDINNVQDNIVRALVGKSGHLTTVGDHRQAIFGWRGGRVEIMAQLFADLKKDPSGEVIELSENFRSTPRIINIANRWAKTIGRVKSMSTPDMTHGRASRLDYDASHMAALHFTNRNIEAKWIADAIKRLTTEKETGATHDTNEGERGLALVDIALLIRSTTDLHTYIDILEDNGIPAVVRAGPDLFSRPEVLLFVAALAEAAGLTEFVGADWDAKSLPGRIRQALGCNSFEPATVIKAACSVLNKRGLSLEKDAANRLTLAAQLINRKLTSLTRVAPSDISKLRTPELSDWLRRKGSPKRLFPQKLYHFLLAEAGVANWEALGHVGKTAMYHLGQLSSLVKGVETPGWNNPHEFKHQISALWLWGTHRARTEEAPLLVPPNAITISTVHAAKGLEFPVIFLADVNPYRFPSSRAKCPPDVPFEGRFKAKVNPADLADNANYDGERRLMYVALTRAERYLFVSHSGQKRSKFFDTIQDDIKSAGGTVRVSPPRVPQNITLLPSGYDRDLRLVTSFSDLRYYLECPHDFYLRKALGFAPTIDQAFGYGRGVHNLLRAIHSDPKRWSKLANDEGALRVELSKLVSQGLFYLRYTADDPFERMRDHALDIVTGYIKRYGPELQRLEFEPERAFETLIKEEQVLVSGAIDVIRLDEPPRVTLLDFKTGEPESDSRARLDEEEMRLQVSLYGLAAKREMEYEPDKGLVLYLDAKKEQDETLPVKLDTQALEKAHNTIVSAAGNIRQRIFDSGPTKKPRNPKHNVRCQECDFLGFCGMKQAKQARQLN